MPNTKTAIKRTKTNLKRTERNKAVRTLIKSSIRRYQNVLASDNIEEAKKSLAIVFKNIDKAVAKRIVHKNNAARKKSQLSRMLNDKLAG